MKTKSVKVKKSDDIQIISHDIKVIQQNGNVILSDLKNVNKKLMRFEKEIENYLRDHKEDGKEFEKGKAAIYLGLTVIETEANLSSEMPQLIKRMIGRAK